MRTAPPGGSLSPKPCRSAPQVRAEDKVTEASNIVFSTVAPSRKLKALVRQNISLNA